MPIQKNGDMYVPAKDNPADNLTRGITLVKLSQLKTWWEGPAFLANSPKDGLNQK